MKKAALALLLLLSVVSPTLAFASESGGGVSVGSGKERGSEWVSIEPHRRNYFLPVSFNWNRNQAPESEFSFEDLEAKFQLSFKVPVWTNSFGNFGDLVFGYTQLSMWQVYHDQSAPFRDTNYEPELFWALGTDYDLGAVRLSELAFGFAHQSNGRGHPELSRSWNRLYGMATFARDGFMASLKAWYRIPEKSSDDDNPDIHKYYGYGELRAAYELDVHVLSLFLRNNLRGKNRGAVELGWSFPVFGKLRGYVQYFNGYGECLLDYDHPSSTLSGGIMLNDWL